MDVEALLKRVDYRGALTPSCETLRGLHRAFILSVPFENLDPSASHYLVFRSVLAR